MQDNVGDQRDVASAGHRARRGWQRGGTLLGFLLGLIVGLGIAVITAMMVNQASIPFINTTVKAPEKPPVSANTEAAAGRADPAALPDPNRTSNALKPRPQPGTPPATRNEVATVDAPDATTGTAPGAPIPPPLPPPSVIGQTPGRGASSSLIEPSGDEAGTPAASSAPATPSGGGTNYLLQAGAFRSPTEAEGMRGKLLMMGYDAQITQAEVNGQGVYRVRIGPYAGLDAMTRARTRLADNGVEATVVRAR